MPLNIDLQQILLHMFNSVLLFGGLYFILYKPIRKFMDDRMTKYEQMKKEAEDIKAEAETMKEDYQKHLDDVRSEIDEMKRQAGEEIAQNRAQVKQEAEEEARDILEKAHKEAVLDREKMLGSAEKDIRALAEAATEKLANQSLAQLYDAFLNQAEEGTLK